MPVAKPSQVIVHRIELQQTERALLEKYIDQQNDGVDDPKLAALKILSNGSNGFFIATGLLIAVPVGIYGFNWFKIQLESALQSIDPEAALEELKEKITPVTDSAQEGFSDSLLGQAFEGASNIFDFIFGGDD